MSLHHHNAAEEDDRDHGIGGHAKENVEVRSNGSNVDVEKFAESVKQHDKAQTPSTPANDANIVTFDPVDGDDPQQWSVARKQMILLVTCMGSAIVTCCSSVISIASEPIQREFHVSEELATLSISLYVLGIAIGPVLLGPLSEFYGRRLIYLLSFASFFLLQFPVAFANHIALLLVFRFLSGAAGSAFLANVGGTIADMYTPIEAFIPMAIFSGMTFLGPVLGPIIGGFVVSFSSRWQWMLYAIIIWSFVELALLIVAAPETLPGFILTRRAKRLRKSTGTQTLYAVHERRLAGLSPAAALGDNVKRVFVLLALEPLLVLLCIWTAIQLGIIYLFFVFFPIVYARDHHFSPYQTGLAFLGMGIGIFLALVTMPLWKRRMVFLGKQRKGIPSPEDRLEPSMLGCLFAPVGLFIFAFTSYGQVHWIASNIGSAIFGIGVFYNFLSIFSYTAMYWRTVAASALAANALVRCAFAAAFPLFGVQMANGLGTAGAAGLLAGLNVIMIPVPFALHRYGPYLRTKSRFVAQ